MKDYLIATSDCACTAAQQEWQRQNMKSAFFSHFFCALHFEAKNNLLAHTRRKSVTIRNEMILSANGQRAKNGWPIKTEIKINKLDKISGNKSDERKKMRTTTVQPLRRELCVLLEKDLETKIIKTLFIALLCTWAVFMLHPYDGNKNGKQPPTGRVIRESRTIYFFLVGRISLLCVQESVSSVSNKLCGSNIKKQQQQQ